MTKAEVVVLNAESDFRDAGQRNLEKEDLLGKKVTLRDQM
jgi:hypothetical protein